MATTGAQADDSLEGDILSGFSALLRDIFALNA